MADEPHEERLKQLEARLEKARGAPPPADPGGTKASWSQGEVAWRMVIEMVSGLLIGMAIGYGLDWLFGTMPVMMVIFTVLGLVAGVKTMLGTASELQRKNEAARAASDERT